MPSSNITNDEDFIPTYETIVLVIDYINYVILFINTISLICFLWLATNKGISEVMGAYRWYILAQTFWYGISHLGFTTWQFFPLPSYTTKNGTTIYMYCASGSGRSKKSRQILHIGSENDCYRA